MDLFLAAVMFIESGNDPNAVGDNGRAIGAYQIHAAYFQDGCEQLFLEKGYPQAKARRLALHMNWRACCRRPEFAGRVVAAYLRRYCPLGVRDRNWAVLAMLHHGGPQARYWPTKADHLYAARVLQQMAVLAGHQVSGRPAPKQFALETP